MITLLPTITFVQVYLITNSRHSAHGSTDEPCNSFPGPSLPFSKSNPSHRCPGSDATAQRAQLRYVLASHREPGPPPVLPQLPVRTADRAHPAQWRRFDYPRLPSRCACQASTPLGSDVNDLCSGWCVGRRCEGPARCSQGKSEKERRGGNVRKRGTNG